jgi:hypothetical protein
MNATSHEPWLVRFVNSRWPVLAIAALLLPAWSLRTIVDKYEVDRKARYNPLEQLTVKVVAGEPPGPVDLARITPIYPDKHGHPRLEITPLGNGEYQFERSPLTIRLFVSNADETQAAITTVEPGESTVTVTLAPLMSATGRLVSNASGEPFGEVDIDWDLSDDRWWYPSPGARPAGCGGVARANADGSFILQGMIPGVDYDLVARTQVKHFGRLIEGRTRLGQVHVDPSRPTELGT